MKKNLIILFITTTLVLSGCTWFGSSKTETSKKVTQIPSGTLITPHKIDGLVVPTCAKLYADLSKKFPKDSSDESYRAAAAILFSNSQNADAAACCENIKDAAVKLKCKK